MGVTGYHCGCAVWSFDRWLGELFASGTPKRRFLSEYARVFNAVEGNTTFYATPKAETVERWRRESGEGFRFCFKFPKQISHERALSGVDAEVTAFLGALAPLEDRLGPFFLQLPPTCDESALPALERFLARLPADFSYAVELRHTSFFSPRVEPRLVDALASREVDRVVLDARVLHATQTRDDWLLESKRRKPRLPVRRQATGRHPFVRIVGNNRPQDSQRCLSGWAEVVADWIAQGRTPFVFQHSPDDFYAPRLCRDFHHLLASRAPVGELPAWPTQAQRERQMDLL